MSRKTSLGRAARVAFVTIAAIHGKWLSSESVAQTATQARDLPVFEVDKNWPKVPPQYKVGDVSNINSDSDGNIYVLHRPRTLKDPDFANAAPPVLVFDPNGNFLRAWGGRSVSMASTSIPRTSYGSAAITARPTGCRG